MVAAWMPAILLGGQVNKVRNNLWPNVLSAPQSRCRSGGQANLLRDQSSRGWRTPFLLAGQTQCLHLIVLAICLAGNAQNVQEVEATGVPAAALNYLKCC